MKLVIFVIRWILLSILVAIPGILYFGHLSMWTVVFSLWFGLVFMISNMIGKDKIKNGDE